MKIEFNDAVVLVTGAASGIGAEVARILAAAGARKLILLDLNEAGLATIASQLECDVVQVVGDVSDEAIWDTLDLTGLTHAVSNAGLGEGAPIIEETLERFRKMTRINLEGSFLCVRAAMRAMQGTGGAIVLVGSTAGLKAVPEMVSYCASKAGVFQMARVAAVEGAKMGIRVNAVAPGSIVTAGWEAVPIFQQLAAEHGRDGAFNVIGSFNPMNRMGTAHELASQIVWLLSDASSYTTGATLVCDGGHTI